jgi:DNA polymerase-3 subunit alpha
MYIPLNVKTNYHLLSSLIDINRLIETSINLGISSIAVTDPSMYSAMDFYKECIKYNIKPIIGLDLKVEDYTVLLYAKNYEGYQNLTRLVYLKQEKSLTLEDLKKYKDNLLCILPYASSSLFEKLHDVFEHLYLGYSNLEEREDFIQINEKTVFVNEVLYFNKNDVKFLKYLYLIRDGKKVSEIDDYKIGNHYLLSNDDILASSVKDDLKWMEEINNLCNIEFSSNPHLLPRYSEDDDFNPKLYLSSLCKAGLQKRLDNKIPNEYVERLKYELSVINKMGFNNYFLVVYDYVKFAKTNNIMIGPGRGSAAGSLVSYCLGITDVDPIKYNLLFERFLNPERVTMPDIDIDFESTRRGEVVDYVINKYGKKRAMPIITFVTLGGKQALRDMARIFNYSLPKLDNLCKMIDVRANLKDNLKNNEGIKRLLITDEDLSNIYSVASFIEGVKRQISIHAAGIVISELELDSFIPLQKYENYYITGYAMEHLEELGLLKMDFLGLANLTTIEGILRDIEKVEGRPLLFKDIPLNDKETLEIFSNVMTEGIFQFESPGMKNFLRKLKPDSFEEIVAANALFRPGPMDNIDSYIKRKYGKEKSNYLHDDLYEILKPTHGIIIYQEQIMQIANILADYSLGEADILRRAMSKKKKDVLINEEAKFIKRSIDKGYDEEVAKRVYNLILKFAGYGFNRAHSVAYSLIGYKMAYLKIHYAKYFMSNLLTNVIGNEGKTKEYINECHVMNQNILKPNINSSMNKYTATKEGILFPLSMIRNVGGITCKGIIEERNKGKFKDFFDFVGRTYGNITNKKTIESLIDADCFKDFGYNHQTLLYNIDNAITYAELVSNVDSSLVEKPLMATVDEMDSNELSKRELAAFGFYLTNHPALAYKARFNNVVSISDIASFFDKVVDVIIYVEKIKVIKTKSNEEMAFITGEDETASTELVMFPSIYKEAANINKNDIIKVRARVEKRMSRYQLSVVKVEMLSLL